MQLLHSSKQFQYLNLYSTLISKLGQGYIVFPGLKGCFFLIIAQLKQLTLDVVDIKKNR